MLARAAAPLSSPVDGAVPASSLEALGADLSERSDALAAVVAVDGHSLPAALRTQVLAMIATAADVGHRIAYHAALARLHADLDVLERHTAGSMGRNVLAMAEVRALRAAHARLLGTAARGVAPGGVLPTIDTLRAMVQGPDRAQPSARTLTLA
jgi:hypothetical protein